jgi:uncharacterized membrane protein YdjX (TVP38/TMEM64 family)
MLTTLGVFLILLVAYTVVSRFSAPEIVRIVGENRLLGVVLFGSIMFGTTVIAPLASLPLVPVIAPFLGPFTTGLASFVGWALGAFVAFFIGRQYGRPVVSKFINLESLRRYEEYVKPETGFLLIVLLRMLLPVDVLSYALGMFSTVSFPVYALATMLGIVWFSFAFAYFGTAVADGDYVLLSGIGVASVLILGGSWHYVRRVIGRRGKD